MIIYYAYFRIALEKKYVDYSWFGEGKGSVKKQV